MAVRMIETSMMDARSNLALEEAIFRLNEGRAVRVWGNETSVIIGRGQLARFETDLDYCERAGIPVVRRFTAGGAVYNGPGNLNWSIFLRKGAYGGKLAFTRDARTVFRTAGSIVVDAIRKLGIYASFEEPNRIVNGEGKVSGMAAYLGSERLLCHGTLLLDADLREAQALTTSKSVQIDRKYARSRNARMSNLGTSEGGFVRSLRETIGEASAEEVVADTSVCEETRLAGELKRYWNPSWNLGDPFGAV